MKVVCESCQAKYQVPDERVAGKKLKIRCKRCSATVLIRGDLVGAAASAIGTSTSASVPASQHAQAALASGATSGSIVPLSLESEPPAPALGSHDHDQENVEQEWHVSLDGDTRGPFGIAELRAWLASTPGGWDAHVWRDGFHDWVEARACTELDPPAVPPALGRYSGHADLGQSTSLGHRNGGGYATSHAAVAAHGGAGYAASHSGAGYASSHGGADYASSHGGAGYASSHGSAGYASSHGSAGLHASHGGAGYATSHGSAGYDDGRDFQVNAGESSPFFAERVGQAGVMDGFQSAGRRNTSLALGAAQASARPRSYGAEFGESARVAGEPLRDRDESQDDSVLFSTSSLQTMTGSGVPQGMPAPAPAATPAPAYVPGPNPGFASGEGSGLIDIRALASLARQSSAHIAPGAAAGNGAARQATRNSGETAGLSFGNDDNARSTSANLASAYARVDSLAPVSHVQTSNAALPLAILGGCALVAAAVLAAVLFTRSARPVETAATAVQDSPAAAAQPRGMHEAPGETALPSDLDGKNSEQPRVLDEDVPDGREQATGTASNDEEELAAKSKQKPRSPHTAVEEKKNATPEEKAKPKKEEKPEQADSSEVMLAEHAKPVKASQPAQQTQPGAQSPAAPAAQPAQAQQGVAAREPAKSSNADVDELLNGKPAPAQKTTASVDDLLAGMDKAPTAKQAAAPKADSADTASGLPEQPSRDEVLAAMRGVEAAVRACPGSEPVSGTAEVSLLISGSTGRVASATVTGITGGVGSCIARAVRNARFPHFTKPTISIKYPYRF